MLPLSFRKLWLSSGGDEKLLAKLKFTDHFPEIASVLPSSFKLDEFASNLIALSTLASYAILQHRLNQLERADNEEDEDHYVVIDRVHASLEFNSEKYILRNGAAVPEAWDPLAGLYPCKDGHFVRIHTNYLHHRQGMLDLLQLNSREDSVKINRSMVAERLQQWDRFEFEEEVARRGLVAVAVRSRAEWERHSQCQQFLKEDFSPVKITPIEFKDDNEGDLCFNPILSTSTSLSSCRPLSGVKVLELTHVIAGPVAGRTLAAHGADVLHVSARHLPSIESLLCDTGRGKRTTSIDLRTKEGVEVFKSLLSEADVLLLSYRPHAIEHVLGADRDTLFHWRPGLILAELCAYGWEGEWAGRRGFDSLTQAATGFNMDEAEATTRIAERQENVSQPKAFPAQALDHGSGYLLSFGIQMALLQREKYRLQAQRQESLDRSRKVKGWSVQVSLAGAGEFLRSLGRQPLASLTEENRRQLDEFVQQNSEEWSGTLGTIRGLTHSGFIAKYPPAWVEGPHALGTHPATWLC